MQPTGYEPARIEVVRCEPRLAAVIRLTIPCDRMREEMPAAMRELPMALAKQSIAPAGPMFSHHFSYSPTAFDFEVGLPVAAPVAPDGRVIPGELPEGTAALLIHRGGYEGLGASWSELHREVSARGLATRGDFWEIYARGPESSSDPADWRTELYLALKA